MSPLLMTKNAGYTQVHETPPPPKKNPSKNLDCDKNIKIITILIVFLICKNGVLIYLSIKRAFVYQKVRNSRKLHKFISNHVPKNPDRFSDLLPSQYHTRQDFLHKHKANLSYPDKDLC